MTLKNKPAKQKKCKVCKELFTPFSSLAKTCSISCAIALTEQDKSKAYKQETKQLKSKLRENDRSFWTKKAQAAFNKYVRERDKHFPCISCGRHHTGQYHAGHYRSVGSCPELRFHPFNNNKQCSVCNNHLSGNQINYRISLIDKIGLDNVEWLESYHEP